MHLHNFRLFCAIGVCFRLGEPCFRCHGRWTAPGVALNCRGSLPGGGGLRLRAVARTSPTVFESVDRFVTPSVYAARQLEKLGLPEGRTDVVPHYIPATAFADGSRAEPRPVRARVRTPGSREGVRLRDRRRGDLRRPAEDRRRGPARARPAQAHRARRGAGRAVRQGAAGHAARHAAARGDGGGADHRQRDVRLRGARGDGGRRAGGRDARGRAAGDRRATRHACRAATRWRWRTRMDELWDDPEARVDEGDAAIARARERFSEERYVRALLSLYSGLTG